MKLSPLWCPPSIYSLGSFLLNFQSLLVFEKPQGVRMHYPKWRVCAYKLEPLWTHHELRDGALRANPALQGSHRFRPHHSFLYWCSLKPLFFYGSTLLWQILKYRSLPQNSYSEALTSLCVLGERIFKEMTKLKWGL
jgi:hypothetical protein